jgi:YD repeat-containing protein
MQDPKNNGACDACIGNPISPGVGNKYQIETDYSSTGPSPLRLQRTYNAASTAKTGPMGANWRMFYERSVTAFLSNVQVPVMVQRQDGKILRFTNANGQFTPTSDTSDRLTRLTNGSGQTIGFQFVTADGEQTEIYDAAGKLTSIIDRNGLTQTLAYDSKNLLSSVTDAFGRQLIFTYDAQARIATVTDLAGGIYQYAYDASSNLTSVTYPGGAQKLYQYNEPANTSGANLPNALTGITDENGVRLATYKYDAQGLAISTEHAGGAGQASLSYGATTSLVTDALNTQRTYGFQTIFGAVRTSSISQPAASGSGLVTQQFTFDANGNVTARTDWNGNRTNYTFDLARNLETSRTEGLTSAGGTTPQTRTITTEWHPTFRLPTRVAEPLRVTTNVYDPDGTQCSARGALCSKSIQATTDANGAQGFSATPSGAPRIWTYTYNANGSPLTINGPRTDVSDVITYTYYANNDADLGKRGNVATVTNAAGHVTNITAYNAHGQPLTIVDPNGMTITLAYDARQRLTSRNSGGEITTYDYDGVGQLSKVTLPDGSFLSYSYDAAHRLTGMSDNLGNSIAYTLDAMGNRTQEQVRDPGNSLVQTRSRVYNNLNRLFQELGAQSQTTEYAYDDQGNVLSVKDPLNHVTANQYDALNRLKQVTDPGTGVTQYAYNGLDALTQVTDPRSLVTGYTVDGLGNLTQQASPDTGTTVNTYDAAGNLFTQTDAKSQVTTYAYDALNRVTLITFHDGGNQSYAYDQGANAIGHLSSIVETDPALQVTSQIAYAYDLHGRVASETRTVSGIAYVTAYAYDTSGRLAGMTYPSGRTLTYGFDALGRVNQVTTTKDGQSQTVISSVAYHPFGGVKGYTLGNGRAYSRNIDLDGRIASYTLGSQSFAIGYDAASRIEFISETANPPNTNTYGYDALDRLTSAVTPSTPYGYTYDAVGNRLTQSAGAGSSTYGYGTTSNRIASITPASGPVRNFTFDSNGSTTADGNNTYVYDTRGRMLQATSSLGATNYQVNALGQRIRKTNSLGDTVFHYDTRGRLIAETDPAGALKREYFYLGDIPVGVAQ